MELTDAGRLPNATVDVFRHIDERFNGYSDQPASRLIEIDDLYDHNRTIFR